MGGGGGGGIKQGTLNRPTSMSDIAPTIAALLHIKSQINIGGNYRRSSEVIRRILKGQL
jgi:hypothetical protein